MSATENQFRGVAFGGFNRQDVLTYVEATAAEHGRQTELLQKELKLAEERCEKQAAALSDSEARETRCTEENSRLSGKLDAAQSELAEKTIAFADLERELAALREKVKMLEPGAEAYAHIKDRTASIELEAHLRAQRVLDEAEASTKESKARVEAWLRRVQTDYDRLRTDMDTTISHVSGELGRVQKSLSNVTADFAAHDDTRTSFVDALRKETRQKAPEPISVEGE